MALREMPQVEVGRRRPSPGPMPTRTGAAASAWPAAATVDYGVNNVDRRLTPSCCRSRSSRDAGSRARTMRRRGRRSSSTGAWRGRSSVTRTAVGQIIAEEREPTNVRRRTRTTSPRSSASSAWSRTSARTASCRRPGTTCSIACGSTAGSRRRRCPSACSFGWHRARRRPSRRRSSSAPWRLPAPGRSRSQPLDAMRERQAAPVHHSARWSSARSPASCC